MKRDILGKCPICDGTIEVTEFKCRSCESTIRGRFKLNKFCQLPKEQLDFAEIFIKNRGNIKEIEKELGISYPTVKGRLDSLIESLGYKNQSNNNPTKNKDILEQLDRGEISPEEAIELLKD
jgi:hypothetical protein